MKSVFVRFLAVLLSAVVIIGMQGCGRNKGADKDTDRRNTDYASVASTDGDEEFLLDVEETDLEGYDIRIASWFDLEPSSDSGYYKAYLKRKKALEEKFNCNISFIQIPASELKETVESTAASADPVADIIRLRSPWVVPGMAGKGLLRSVDQYFDLNDPLWNKTYTLESMYKGKPYGVNSSPTTSWACVWYNRSLIKQAKLKDPIKLLAEKTWTWDKWIEYSTAIAKLSSEKRKVFGTNIPNYLAFITSNNGRVVRNENDRDVWSLDAPESIDALKYLKNVIGMDMVGGDVNEFANGSLGFFFSFNWVNDFSNSITDEWGILPYPMGPNSKDYTAYNEELQLMCLPSSAQYPKETSKIWTELSRSYPGIDPAKAIYSRMLSKEKDVETALMIQSKFALDRYWGYEDIKNNIIHTQNGNSLGDILEDKTSRPIEEWVSEITPTAKSYIDKVWSQHK